MLKRDRRYTIGVSAVEYMILFVMFLAAILVMHKQVGRVFMGRWKDLGDSFGYGQQYDVNATVECGRHVPRIFNAASQESAWGTEIWYGQKCFECCRYVNGATGNFEATCPGFVAALGDTLEECRSDTAHPSDYGKSTCCATGCKLAVNCNF